MAVALSKLDAMLSAIVSSSVIHNQGLIQLKNILSFRLRVVELAPPEDNPYAKSLWETRFLFIVCCLFYRTPQDTGD